MKKLIIFIDWFDPAFKAGGPIRSCVNLVKALEGKFEISIVTSDSDLDGKMENTQLAVDEWVKYGKQSRVIYLSNGSMKYNRVKSLIFEISPDVIILNGLFSVVFTLYPLYFNLINSNIFRVLVFPRGMLKPSALAVKKSKKVVFFSCFKFLFSKSNISFLCSDETEVEEVNAVFKNASTLIAGNFPDVINVDLSVQLKVEGELEMVFVGRIHPIKNLKYLLERIKQAEIRGSLTIIGVLEDDEYWRECKEIAKNLQSVKVNYLGELPYSMVRLHVSKSQVFVLPTLGENFGHAIAEALSLGKPVIISDKTPWRQLQEKGVGWDIALNSEEIFVESLKKAASWNQTEYETFCRRAFNWFKENSSNEELIKLYTQIIEDVPTRN